jgi:hypothetical protein
LLTATKEPDISEAQVLADVLSGPPLAEQPVANEV